MTGSRGRLLSSRGAQRRMQALIARGWTRAKLYGLLGISSASFYQLMTRRQVRLSRHLEVVDLYERLWNVAPPLATSWDRSAASYALVLARTHGYAPPMAWDDIDEDDGPAVPDEDVDIDDVAVELAVAGEDVRVTTAERREALRILNARGLADGEIAALLRVNVRTVLRTRDELRIGPNSTTARERVAA